MKKFYGEDGSILIAKPSYKWREVAWKEGDDEIKTYKSDQCAKILLAFLLIAIAGGFIIGNLVIKNL